MMALKQCNENVSRTNVAIDLLLFDDRQHILMICDRKRCETMKKFKFRHVSLINKDIKSKKLKIISCSFCCKYEF